MLGEVWRRGIVLGLACSGSIILAAIVAAEFVPRVSLFAPIDWAWRAEVIGTGAVFALGFFLSGWRPVKDNERALLIDLRVVRSGLKCEVGPGQLWCFPGVTERYLLDMREFLLHYKYEIETGADQTVEVTISAKSQYIEGQMHLVRKKGGNPYKAIDVFFESCLGDYLSYCDNADDLSSGKLRSHLDKVLRDFVSERLRGNDARLEGTNWENVSVVATGSVQPWGIELTEPRIVAIKSSEIVREEREVVQARRARIKVMPEYGDAAAAFVKKSSDAGGAPVIAQQMAQIAYDREGVLQMPRNHAVIVHEGGRIEEVEDKTIVIDNRPTPNDHHAGPR